MIRVSYCCTITTRAEYNGDKRFKMMSGFFFFLDNFSDNNSGWLSVTNTIQEQNPIKKILYFKSILYIF